MTAFFSPGCQACTQLLPRFVEFAEGFTGEAIVVIAANDVAQSVWYQQKIAGVARTVVEPANGVVATAFAVSSFPAPAVTDADGLVLANGNAVSDLAFLGEAVTAR